MARLADAVAGAPVLAAWHNSNRDRTITPFTNAAQRASQWPSPPDGALSYLEDQPGVVWYFDNAAWSAVGTSRRVGGTWDRNTDLSIVDLSFVDIPWNAETFDSDGFLTPTSATLTIPAGGAGLYVAAVEVIPQFAATVNVLSVQPFIGATPQGEIWRGSSVAVSGVSNFVATWFAGPLTAGQTIKFQAAQGSGATRNFRFHLELYRVST